MSLQTSIRDNAKDFIYLCTIAAIIPHACNHCVLAAPDQDPKGRGTSQVHAATQEAQPSSSARMNNDGTTMKSRINSQGLEIVTVTNSGAMREELKVKLVSCDRENFTGSLTMQEAKHGIFRDCMGFRDFKNFDHLMEYVLLTKG